MIQFLVFTEKAVKVKATENNKSISTTFSRFLLQHFYFSQRKFNENSFVRPRKMLIITKRPSNMSYGV